MNEPTYSLHRIQCDDGLLLNGVLFEPSIASKTAIVFIGGLKSTVLHKSALLDAFSRQAETHGTAVLGLNSRGAGVILGVRKLDPESEKGYTTIPQGTTLERFEDCVLDVRAAVRFLRDRGYKRVVLVGHSTGSNKMTYSLAQDSIKGVVGAALLGPASDVGSHEQDVPKRHRKKNMKRAEKMIENGEGDDLLTLVGEEDYISAHRYISLYSPGGPEDVFPTYDKKATFDTLAKVNVPLYICFGEEEEYTTHHPEDELEILAEAAEGAASVETSLIPDAMHSFTDQEDVLAHELFDWISSL